MRRPCPFPGNQVPTTRFDPIASKVLAILPVGAPGTGIVQYLSRFVQNDDQFVARGDEVINKNLRIYASYIHDGLQEPSTSIPGNLLTATTNSTWLSCIVPAIEGAYFSERQKEALWDRFFTGAPARQRQSVERYNIVKRA